MDDFWDKAQSLPFQGAPAGSYVAAGPFRGVLHTTEVKSYAPSQTTYYGHTDAPHFTLAQQDGKAVMFQHYPISRAARALEHRAGTAQTNNQCAIQIEIAWRAEEIETLPDDMVALLKEWMRWVEAQTGVRKESPPFLGEEASGSGSPSRMSVPSWLSFNGWCGHQHVPNNDHWDPGPIDIKRLFDL